MQDKLPNIHPGEVLFCEFLQPMNLTAETLANRMGIPDSIILDLICNLQPITPDLDAMLCKEFKTSQGFWLRLQADYDRGVKHAK